MKIILACDESGAKGYADQDEQFPGQVGVFAGLFVPEEMLSVAEPRLEAAIAPYRGGDGKLHITDLQPSQQAGLRADLFAVILDLKLPCFWYAIHVAGFQGWHQTVEQLHANARTDTAASNPNPRIKVGSPREKPESLHAILFTGLYAHIVAYIEERNPGPVDIVVRTDNVDAPIAKLFRQKAADLLDMDPRTSSATGFDTVTKTVVSAQMRFEAQIPPELRVATTVDSLAITPVGDEDPTVVAADVLANSLCHLFHNRPAERLYADLNRPSAVEDHPLLDVLATFRNWGGPDISDRMYRHPAAPPFEDV
ncbi:hypothetical protein [Novosphingobium pokkalii]|uniref:DUF3800 domain-containing protein n=1 Tax=Novosphingobium pokkalii TaxID=1770194 RepID=A0ABV7UZD1_9SPHN|nr:hypothetical protein [Novosphingobium pokkalii]GHC97311.1 hypothetical protein GCM10019060_28030 [Novosphingobium pokkalii]